MRVGEVRTMYVKSNGLAVGTNTASKYAKCNEAWRACAIKRNRSN